MRMLFYTWCLLENMLTHWFALDFLLRSARRTPSRTLLLWLLPDAALTLAAMALRVPWAFAAELCLLALFTRAVLKLRAEETAAPMIVLAALFTLREGGSALVLSWACRNLNAPAQGIPGQILFSALTLFLFWSALRLIGQRCKELLRQPVTVRLPELLLSCALVLAFARCALRLDSTDFSAHFYALGREPRFALSCLLIGSAGILMVLTGAFCSISALTVQGERAAFLEKQLRSQQDAFRTMQRQNTQYAAFQHDIDNHLLVVSGLLRENGPVQAGQYLEKLRRKPVPKAPMLHTGCPALDVLLGEKLADAAQCGITAACDVCIPEACGIDGVELCGLAANLVDNAVTACKREPSEQRTFTLVAKMRGAFLLVETVNPSSARKPFLYGTGLRNVRRTAQRWRGTMEAVQENGQFRVSVLLSTAIHDAERTI